MRWRVIARYRSQVRTIVFILLGKFIAETLDIYSELVRDHVSCAASVVLRVMSFAGVGSPMRQLFIYTELLRDKSPVLLQPLEFSDEIGEHISVGINKPIQLVTVRRRVNAGCTAILDRIDKLFECHLVSELQPFGALIERDNAIPWVAHKSALEVRLELFAPDYSPLLFRTQQIKSRQNPIFSATITRPIRLHLVFDLPQIQMRFPCFAQNGPHAGRARLRYLNKN